MTLSLPRCKISNFLLLRKQIPISACPRHRGMQPHRAPHPLCLKGRGGTAGVGRGLEGRVGREEKRCAGHWTVPRAGLVLLGLLDPCMEPASSEPPVRMSIIANSGTQGPFWSTRPATSPSGAGLPWPGSLVSSAPGSSLNPSANPQAQERAHTQLLACECFCCWFCLFLKAA